MHLFLSLITWKYTSNSTTDLDARGTILLIFVMIRSCSSTRSLWGIWIYEWSFWFYLISKSWWQCQSISKVDIMTLTEWHILLYNRSHDARKILINILNFGQVRYWRLCLSMQINIIAIVHVDEANNADCDYFQYYYSISCRTMHIGIIYSMFESARIFLSFYFLFLKVRVRPIE